MAELPICCNIFGAPPPFSSWTWDQAMAELPPFCSLGFGAPPPFSSWTWDQAMAELPPFCCHILVPLLLSHPGLGTRQWRSYHPSTFFSDVDILPNDIHILRRMSGGLPSFDKRQFQSSEPICGFRQLLRPQPAL